MSEPRAPAVLRVNLTAATSLYNLDLEESASFDREGRLLYYFRGPECFKRSLGNGVFRRARERGRWERLSEDAASATLARAYGLAERARGAATGEAAARLDREVLRWTPAELAAERARFDAVYKPISILPPDAYQAIVVQATEGCTWNRCTFCSFYLDRPFTVRSPAAFAAHVDGVLELLGRERAARRGVFVADGNALAVAWRQLEPLVEIVAERLPGEPLSGFVDLFSGERRPTDHWNSLAAAGLERVSVGMETGDDELLAFVNKPGSRAELVEFAGELKSAGLALGLIAIVGLGGRENRVRHRRETLAALDRMALTAADIVYLSPLVERPGSAYALAREARGWEPLSETGVAEELARWRLVLRQRGVRSSLYDIREFIY